MTLPVRVQSEQRGEPKSDYAGLLSPKLAALVIAAIVYIGLVANTEVAALLAQGKRLDLTQSTLSVWQYVREGLTVMLAFALIVGVGRSKRRRYGRITVSVAILFVLLYFGGQVLRVFLDTAIPDTYAFLGLRFLYLASIVASIARYEPDARGELLRRLAFLLVPMLLIEVVIALQQILFAPPVLGATAFGSRPWGTYASSNNLGLAALGFALIFAITKFRGHQLGFVLAGMLCVSTGSRTAILGFLLVTAGILIQNNRHRAGFIPIGIAGFLGIYIAVSSEAVSGRDINGEARFETWGAGLSNLHSVGEYLFGKGLGVGSNAATVLNGKISLGEDPAVVDSTVVWVLLSIGITGLVFFACALVTVMIRIRFDQRFTILPAIVLCALTFNMPELSPLNILVAVAVGTSLKPRSGSPILAASELRPSQSRSRIYPSARLP